MREATFTFQVDEILKNAFSTAAKAHDLTGEQLLRDFMRDYVKQQQQAPHYDEWLRTKVQRSQASANAGELVTTTEVEARFVARRTATRRRLDAPK